MNLNAMDWDQRLIDFAGARRDQLSPVQPSGYAVGPLLEQASQATGLRQEVLVVNGAHDQYCAAVGAGVTRPGQVLLSCGTAWVVLAVPEDKDAALEGGLAVSHHAMQGRWGALRSMGGVGTSFEWLLDNVWGRVVGSGAQQELYGAVNRAISGSPPGARDLLFVPLSGGHSLAFARTGGGFMGLTLAHNRADMARAVMEGIAFELRWVIEQLLEAGLEVTGLTMVGGAAESSVWPQIVSDATALPVTLPSSRQAASRGAAILAGVGAGVFASAEAGFSSFGGQDSYLTPDPALQPLYGDRFRAYQDRYELLKTG
jgi:xylulokinase